jgi:hypothetical protein
MISRDTVSRLFALARLGYGAGLIASPGRVATPWIGADAQRSGAKVAVRALGVRDSVLAAGVLAHARDGSAQRPWIAACAISDLVDLAATLATPEDALPPHARAGTAALAGGAALVGALLYASLDR